MINYRVENLEALITEFKKSGVTVVDTIEVVDYGKLKKDEFDLCSLNFLSFLFLEVSLY